jgi:hypothetical protein
VQGKAVFVRINGDRADANLMGAAKYPNRDLAPIGDEQFFNGFHAARGSDFGRGMGYFSFGKTCS